MPPEKFELLAESFTEKDDPVFGASPSEPKDWC
jgi:hypothetical protein